MQYSQDNIELRRLVNVYCSYVDDSDADAMAGLFADEGALIVYPPGSKPGIEPPLRQWQGKAGFTNLIAALGESYVRWVHFLGNHWVDIVGDSARGETYCTAAHLRNTVDGQFEEVNFIRYWDHYIRTPAGWRFQQRNACKQWGTIRRVDSGLHELDKFIHGQAKPQAAP